jgi:5'-3' exonuclease
MIFSRFSRAQFLSATLLTWARAYSSHLMGFFYRTIRIVENGIKPAYVFDGKPPDLKAGVVRVNSCSRATYEG